MTHGPLRRRCQLPQRAHAGEGAKTGKPGTFLADQGKDKSPCTPRFDGTKELLTLPHLCGDCTQPPTFLPPLPFLPSGGEPITSETRLLSYGPLVRLVLTRRRASDNGGVKCASGGGGVRKFGPFKSSGLVFGGRTKEGLASSPRR